jgi:NtrC-family two-component system response regulator AlgB
MTPPSTASATSRRNRPPVAGASRLRALVIEADRGARKAMRESLEAVGVPAREAESAEAAMLTISVEPVDLAFLSFEINDRTGLDLLTQLLIQRRELSVVVTTEHPSVDTAIEAMRRGASDYLRKPCAPAQLRLVMDRLRDQREAAQRVANLERLLRGKRSVRTQGVEPIPASRTALTQAVIGGDFTLERVERDHILQVLSRAKSLEQAAKILGIDNSTLWRKRKKFERSGRGD